MGDDGDLTEDERAFLTLLSVFAGGFTIDAAQSVAASAGSIDVGAVEGVVAHLVRRSLVLEDPASPGRYRLSGAPRRPSPDHDAARDAHLAWARSFAEQGAAALDGPRQDVWLDALDAEHENFRAALEWGAAKGGSEAALGLAAALGRFWEMRGHTREGRGWLDRMVRLNPGAPAGVRANAANSAGLLALRDRDYGAAHAHYEDSLALHWELEDRLGASGALHALGNVAFQERETEEARRLFEESLHIGRELRDDRVVAASLTNLGAVAEVRTDHATALSLYGEALALWQALGDTFNAAAVLANLAQIALAERDLVAARRWATEALDARRLVGDKAGMASTLRVLITVARRQGDRDSAHAFETQRRALLGEAEEGWLGRIRRRRP